MMGSSLGTRLAEQGHTIIYGTRAPESEKAKVLVGRTQGNAVALSQFEAAAAGKHCHHRRTPFGRRDGGHRFKTET